MRWFRTMTNAQMAPGATCPRCGQSGPHLPGREPCPECGRNTVHE